MRDPESTSDWCDLELSPPGSAAYLRPASRTSSTTRHSPAPSIKPLLSMASSAPNGGARWPCGSDRPPVFIRKHALLEPEGGVFLSKLRPSGAQSLAKLHPLLRAAMWEVPAPTQARPQAPPLTSEKGCPRHTPDSRSPPAPCPRPHYREHGWTPGGQGLAQHRGPSLENYI